jgi:hypothetical protein
MRYAMVSVIPQILDFLSFGYLHKIQQNSMNNSGNQNKEIQEYFEVKIT